MDDIKIALSPTAPLLQNMSEIYDAINDLYVQMYSLVAQLNRYQGIYKSPNGHYWRVEVDNSGVVTTTDLGLTLSI